MKKSYFSVHDDEKLLSAYRSTTTTSGSLLLQHSSETTSNYLLDVIHRRRCRAARLIPVTANVQDDIRVRATQLTASVTCTISCSLLDAPLLTTWRNLVIKPPRSCATRERNLTFRQDLACDLCLQMTSLMAPLTDCLLLHTNVCESSPAITRASPLHTRM